MCESQRQQQNAWRAVPTTHQALLLWLGHLLHVLLVQQAFHICYGCLALEAGHKVGALQGLDQQLHVSDLLLI